MLIARISAKVRHEDATQARGRVCARSRFWMVDMARIVLPDIARLGDNAMKRRQVRMKRAPWRRRAARPGGVWRA